MLNDGQLQPKRCRLSINFAANNIFSSDKQMTALKSKKDNRADGAFWLLGQNAPAKISSQRILKDYSW